MNEDAANVPSSIGPAWRHAGIAALVACGVCFFVWMPFMGRLDLFTRHFDGPCYMVVAKTFYRPTAVNPLPGDIVQPAYFTIHFPVFPAGIRAFAAASAAAFDLYVRKVVPEVAPLVALLAFLLIPSRHTLFRALGSAEGAFALFLLLAVWAFHEERSGLAFAAAGLSAVTRINGLLVIAVLALVPFGALCLWFWHLYRSPFQFLAVHGSKRTPFPFAEIAEKIRERNWEGAELLVAFVVMMALGAARLWTMKLPVE